MVAGAQYLFGSSMVVMSFVSLPGPVSLSHSPRLRRPWIDGVEIKSDRLRFSGTHLEYIVLWRIS